MSQHEQVSEVNIDCKQSGYPKKAQLQAVHGLRKGEGLFKIGKTFHLEVLKETASTAEAETAGETNFSFTFQLCKGQIPTDEKACDSQMGLNNRAECGEGIQVWGFKTRVEFSLRSCQQHTACFCPTSSYPFFPCNVSTPCLQKSERKIICSMLCASQVGITTCNKEH